jgi:hypothetical protein
MSNKRFVRSHKTAIEIFAERAALAEAMIERCEGLEGRAHAFVWADHWQAKVKATRKGQSK